MLSSARIGLVNERITLDLNKIRSGIGHKSYDRESKLKTILALTLIK